MSDNNSIRGIPKKYPYKLCMKFNEDNKLMGYLTYIAYKDYKLAWIQNYKKEHNGNEPNKYVLDQFKNGLIEDNYESFITKAKELEQELFKPLVLEAVADQLPTAIANSNYKKIEKMLEVRSMDSADNNSTKYVGNAVHEIHNATTHKCKSFAIAIAASALGAFCLALILIVINLLSNHGFFLLLTDLCVPGSNINH